MRANETNVLFEESDNGQRLLFERSNGAPGTAENGHAKAPIRSRKKLVENSAPEVASLIVAAITPVLERFEARLNALEAALQSLGEALVTKDVEKEFYSTAEVAKILGKRPYTVREWCRLGRVNGQKALSGRGLDDEWRISHVELVRIQNEGLLEVKAENRVGSAGRITRPR